MRADAIFIGVEVDDAVAQRHRPSRPSSPRSAPSTSTPSKAATRSSSRRTSTSACSAGCASTPPPTGAVRVLKLYDEGAALEHA